MALVDPGTSTGTIRAAIAKVIPGYGKIENIDRTKEEFHIAGRTFHTPQFSTEDGRAHLHAHRLPESREIDENEFRDRFASDEIKTATQDDFRKARAMGATGFPTLIVTTGQQGAVLTQGYQPIENLKGPLKRWLAQDPGLAPVSPMPREEA